MSGPLWLFAHGAGAGSDHPWMQAWAERLGELGDVVTFDYPYMAAGKRRPDRLPKLLAAHREALEEAGAGHDGPVFLAGKSMGSRVGCHLAGGDDAADVAGLVCFGYPLVSGGKRRKLRDQPLVHLKRPVLFIQGTRDRLCPLDVLAEVRPRMSVRNELHVVEEGDHSLRVTRRWEKKTGLTQDDANASMLEAIRSFAASCR